MSLQNEHTLHPVTALDFFREQDGRLLVLAGEGPYLKVFEAETSLLVRQCRIFEGQTIHGITIHQDVSTEDDLQAVIWGGSSISMFTKKDLHQLLQSGVGRPDPATTVSDWILDVAISPYEDGSCVLITAHNTVLRVSLGNSTSITLEELHSPSRSILYSAHLVWDSSNEILVAAGTVFGEIIAWKCSIPGEAAQSKGEVLFTFIGHEGSIFGVNISPPITFGDHSTGRLLASCSDDRSIRVWDLSLASANGSESHTALRETGFGNDDAKIENRCLAVAMGHTSRIWRVKFLVEGSQIPNLIDILSFGEDSTTQQWSLNFKSDYPNLTNSKGIEIHTSLKPGQLQHQKSFAFHSGKHIGSATTINIGVGHTLIATGGADGKISMYPVEISERLQLQSSVVGDEEAMAKGTADDGFLSSSWSAEDVLSLFPGIETLETKTPIATVLKDATTQDLIPSDEKSENLPTKKKKAKKAPKDSFARYAFTSENRVVVTTTFGRVLSGEIQGRITWKELFLPASGKDDLRSWSVIKSLPEAGLVYLAGANGKIYGSASDDILVEVGSVEGKVADMFVVSDPSTAHSELLVTTLARNTVQSFAIDRASNDSSFKGNFTYELPPKFVVTSASGVSGNFLVLGSRYGSLAIYNHDGQLIQLEDSHSSLNGDAITSIIPMPSGPNERLHFLVTGRKGAYSIFAFNAIKNSDGFLSLANLSLVHQGSPPFGPMIENAWLSGSDLILYGFKSKNFIVWNETQKYEIMSVECGGAHRSYAYSPTNKGGHFIYTKTLQLYLYSQPSPSHKIIKHGGHGREIKACAVSEDQTLFATGAEDTAIRIWSYTTQLNCLAVVQKHTAGIQHLQWHKSSYLFSSGGSEEFFIWAVEQLPSSGIGIMCEASRPDQSPNGDLRIMNFDVTALPATTSTTETTFLISLAYSDSTIRVYTYSKSTRYQLVAKGRYTSSCLLQIKHLQVVNTTDFMLLTAATDGNITLWKSSIPSESLLQISTQNIHQSSIKTLDIVTTSSYTVIATGGDDNALAISLLEIANPLVPMRVFILRAAHAAAITGLAFVPVVLGEEEKEGWRIVTSSNDQRMKEWAVKIGEEGDVKIRKVGDAFTPVADVGDVACLRSGREERKVLVVGNGMEVWKVGRDIKG